MLNEQKAGPVSSADGAIQVGRIDGQGAGVITQAHGAYAEGSQRKTIFFSYAAAVAASEPATTQLGNIVWNPPGSGVNLSFLLWSCQIQVTSATTFGVTFGYTAQAITPTGPTAITAGGCTYLDASSPGFGKAKAYNACTLLVAPTPVMIMFHNTAAIQTIGVDQMHGDLEGLFTVPPGYAVALSALNNAVTAAGMTSTLTWEEIPIV